MLTTFSTMNKSVLDIMATYQDKINEAVAESLKKNAIGQANEQTIGLLVEDLKGSMIGKVSEAVRELPYYDEATIEKLHLGDADKQYLKNINRFAEKFSQKNKLNLTHSNQTLSQARLDKLKETAGMELKTTRTITLAKGKEKYTRVQLLVNPLYKFKEVSTNYGSVKQINDNEFVIELNQPAEELTINYKLEYKEDVLLMTPAVVDVKADTVRNISVAQGKGEEAEVVAEDGTKQKKTLYSKEDKDFHNTITQTQVIFPFELPFKFSDSNEAIYNDLKNYNNLFTVVKTIYGLDLNKDNFDSLEPKEGSLLKKAELKDINKILTSLVEKTITNQLKKELTIPQEKFDEIKVVRGMAISRVLS